MTLLEKIETDRTQARRDGKADIASFLSYLISETRRIGKDDLKSPNRDSTDDEAVDVIRRMIARNDENIVLTKGHDQTADWQNKLLKTYLPTQMSDEVLETTIKGIIENLGQPKSPKLMGTIMGALKLGFPGQYSPQLASQITKKLLS